MLPQVPKVVAALLALALRVVLAVPMLAQVPEPQPVAEVPMREPQ
jgi:hypothetical protein